MVLKRFRNEMSQIKPITINVKIIEAETNKPNILQQAILINQFLNSFIFPFPITWNKARERYEVKSKSLRFYWVIILLKFVYILFSIFVGIGILSNERYREGSHAGQLVFLNVTLLIVTSFVDAVFILNAYDIVNSFNWSYKMEKRILSNLKIGKFINFTII